MRRAPLPLCLASPEIVTALQRFFSGSPISRHSSSTCIPGGRVAPPVTPRVLFDSKPSAPPWHDGSKNLVRDVAANLTRALPTVMTTPGAPSVGPRVTHEAIYGDAGRFSPALLSNARVLRRLAFGDPHDLWHFVFAPNPASSTAALVAKRLRA